MGKKYIIELPENTHWIQWIMEGTKDHHPYMDYKQVEDLTPYTEPDMEQVRKEAYDNGYETAKHECEDCPKQAYTDALKMETYQQGLNDLWEAMQKAIKMYCEIDNEVFLRVFHDVKCDWGESVLQALFKNTPQHLIDSIRQYEQEKEMDGLRQNIQTIVDQCGYTLDEIASVLQKMKES